MRYIPLKLGLYPTVAAYRRALRVSECVVDPEVHEALDQAKLGCPLDLDVMLVVASVAELGFKKKFTKYSSICARGRKKGWKLCIVEVALALRLTHGDQPSGEWLHIAMRPIRDGYGDPKIFVVGNDDGGLMGQPRGRCLIGMYGYPDFRYTRDALLAFMVPRKSVSR